MNGANDSHVSPVICRRNRHLHGLKSLKTPTRFGEEPKNRAFEAIGRVFLPTRFGEEPQLIVLPEHRTAALSMSRRSRSSALEQAFDALGPEARQFHLCLKRQPVKTGIHLRRLLGLARVYGSAEVVSAIAQALELAAHDAAYVENLLLAERRRRQLPTPTLPTPRRGELIDEIDLEPTDPAVYDRFCNTSDEDSDGTS